MNAAFSAARKLANVADLELAPADFDLEFLNEAVGRASLDHFMSTLTPAELDELQAAIDRAKAP